MSRSTTQRSCLVSPSAYWSLRSTLDSLTLFSTSILAFYFAVSSTRIISAPTILELPSGIEPSCSLRQTADCFNYLQLLAHYYPTIISLSQAGGSHRKLTSSRSCSRNKLLTFFSRGPHVTTRSIPSIPVNVPLTIPLFATNLQ